jgi:hypothetical protein
VKWIIGTLLLQDLTESVIRGYMKTRIEETACGRTINMKGANCRAQLGAAVGTGWNYDQSSAAHRDAKRRNHASDVGTNDFEKRLLTLGRAKTASGTGGQIPMNNDLFTVFASLADWFTQKFGQAKPEHYLSPSGSPCQQTQTGAAPRQRRFGADPK